MHIGHRIALATLVLLPASVVVLAAADQPAATSEQVAPLTSRLDELERQIKTLQSQVDGANGPAAAVAMENRVWKLEADALTDNGFSVAGVGDVGVHARRTVGRSVTADVNPIFLYSFKESVLFVAELNAHKDGVALGQAWIGVTSLPHLTVAAGLFPLPFGIYSERLSPSWVNKFSNLAPAPYDDDYGVFAGDQTANGLQVRGDIPLAAFGSMNYHAFAVAAPTYGDPDANNPDHRLAFGKPSTDHIPPTFGARVGWLPLPQAELGVSAMAGRIINNQTVDPTIDTNARRTFSAVALDAEFHHQGAVIRGEYVRVDFDDPSGAQQHTQGAYLQGSHRLSMLSGWKSGIEPVVRVGWVRRSSTDNGYANVSEFGIGVNYYFTPFIRSSLLAMDHTDHALDQLDLNTTFSF